MNIIWTDWSRDTTTLIRWLKNWKNETSFLKQEALKENNMEEELNILKEMIAKHDPKAESYLKELAEKYNSPENKKLFRQFARRADGWRSFRYESPMSLVLPVFLIIATQVT